MLAGEVGRLPAREAALARFATALTERPWTLGPGDTADLAGAGLARDEVEAATGVVAMFNYLTRVADASGIEFDYQSPLPAFVPDRDRRPAERPELAGWPRVPARLRGFRTVPAVAEAWSAWRAYVFEADEPLTRRQRGVLALAAARACCDATRVDELAGHDPADAGEQSLAAFADALSRRPWLMGAADLDRLRAAGHPEPALLHAVSVVALQNAESRLAMGRALLEV